MAKPRTVRSPIQPPQTPPMGAPRVIPMPMPQQKKSLRPVGMLVILAISIILVISAFPIAKGAGERISLGDAALVESRALLAEAKALELEGQAKVLAAKGDMYAALPDTFAKGGTMALQIGVAIFIVILGLALLWLFFTLGINLGSGGVIRVIATVRQPQQTSNLLSEGQRAYLANPEPVRYSGGNVFSGAGYMADESLLDAWDGEDYAGVDGGGAGKGTASEKSSIPTNIVKD